MTEVNAVNILKEMVTPVEIILEDIGFIGRVQAEEIIEKLINNVIKQIPQEYENIAINKFIIYFTSMVHICDSYNIDTILDKYNLEKDLSVIYDRIGEEELVKYLKVIEKSMYDIEGLDKAIEICDKYEVPHYMKIILCLERNKIRLPEEIIKLHKDIKMEILYSYNNTNALRNLLSKEVIDLYFGKGESPLRLVDEVIDCDFAFILRALQ